MSNGVRIFVGAFFSQTQRHQDSGSPTMKPQQMNDVFLGQNGANFWSTLYIHIINIFLWLIILNTYLPMSLNSCISSAILETLTPPLLDAA